MKILMDCDCGQDDALALKLLLKSGIRLMGVSTCFGGFPSQKAAAQVQRILQAEGRKISVCAGANRAIARKQGPVHEDSGFPWQGLTTGAGEFLSQQLAACDTPVTILATGPLTNVAAMLRTSTVRPARIVVMGGGIYGGNRTKQAEFNFWCDPEAANEVLQSGVPITLLPLEAAASCALTEESIQHFSPDVQALVREQMAFSLRIGCGSGDSAIPYDAVAAAGLINPEVFAQTRSCRGIVDCADGPNAGALRIENSSGPVELVESADPAAFYRVLTELFS